MNLKFFNWQSINEKAEWELALQYHKHSEYGSYSEKRDYNRREMIEHILCNFKSDITTGKRYFSPDIINLENLTKGFEKKVRKDIQIINHTLFKGPKFLELNINDSNLKLFNKYIITCSPEKKDEVKILYYNFINNYYETLKTTDILSFQQVLIGPNDNFEIAVVITLNLRFLVEFYGESAYRLGLLETGAVVDEILKSQSTFTKSEIRFKDQKINSLLNLKGNAEIPIAILL